jgi:hypothetical protein
VVLCIKSLGHYFLLDTRRHHTVIVLLYSVLADISLRFYACLFTPAFCLLPILSSTLSIPSTSWTRTPLFPPYHLSSFRLSPA